MLAKRVAAVAITPRCTMKTVGTNAVNESWPFTEIALTAVRYIP